MDEKTVKYKCIECEEFTDHILFKTHVFSCLETVECKVCGTRMQRAKLEMLAT